MKISVVSGNKTRLTPPIPNFQLSGALRNILARTTPFIAQAKLNATAMTENCHKAAGVNKSEKNSLQTNAIS
jgi:phosphoenolpyruvate carboxylase